MTYYNEMTHTHDVALDNEHIFKTAPSVFATHPVEEVSDKYGFVPTINVIDGLRNEGWYPVDASQKNVRKVANVPFTKHLVRFRRLDNDIMVGDSAVELLLTNSHDRTSGFILHAGVFRMACANGIVIADSTFQKVSIRHNRLATNRVIEGAYHVVNEVPRITESIESMQAIDLSPNERRVFANGVLSYMTPEPKQGALETVTPTDRIIAQMLRPKRSADTGTDLWSTYNVLQEKALRGGIEALKYNPETGQHRNTTTRAVTSIDKNIKLNKALWEMATTMKAIKEAA